MFTSLHLICISLYHCTNSPSTGTLY